MTPASVGQFLGKVWLIPAARAEKPLPIDRLRPEQAHWQHGVAKYLRHAVYRVKPGPDWGGFANSRFTRLFFQTVCLRYS
jgi:hypothetical protein